MRLRYLENNFHNLHDFFWFFFPEECSSVSEERSGADIGEISTDDARLDDEAVILHEHDKYCAPWSVPAFKYFPVGKS